MTKDEYIRLASKGDPTALMWAYYNHKHDYAIHGPKIDPNKLNFAIMSGIIRPNELTDHINNDMCEEFGLTQIITADGVFKLV